MLKHWADVGHNWPNSVVRGLSREEKDRCEKEKKKNERRENRLSDRWENFEKWKTKVRERNEENRKKRFEEV